MGYAALPTRRLFERGPACRGLAVDRDGVALGPMLALVWREGGQYRAAGLTEVGLLLREGFRDHRDPGLLADMLAKIAGALDHGDLMHAQMLGLQTEFAALDFGRLDDWPARAARLAKYDSDEPRVPAGSGRPSGEWTAEGAGPPPVQGAFLRQPSGELTPPPGNAAPRFGPVIPPEVWYWLAEQGLGVAARAAGVLGLLVVPYPSDGRASEPVPGRPDLILVDADNATDRTLYQLAPDGTRSLVARLHSDDKGVFRDEAGNIYGAWIGGQLVLDPDALPAPATMGLPNRAEPQAAPAPTLAPDDLTNPGSQSSPANDARPRLCPVPTPDQPHGAKEAAWAYQEQITGLPRGLAVRLNGVDFDGCRESDGTMLEAKGPGYAKFLDSNGEWLPWWDGKYELMNQAIAQSAAAGSRQIEWYVAEPRALFAIKKMISDLGIQNITVLYERPVAP